MKLINVRLEQSNGYTKFVADNPEKIKFFSASKIKSSAGSFTDDKKIAVATKVAKSKGCTVEDVLNEWKISGESGKEHGRFVDSITYSLSKGEEIDFLKLVEENSRNCKLVTAQYGVDVAMAFRRKIIPLFKYLGGNKARIYPQYTAACFTRYELEGKKLAIATSGDFMVLNPDTKKVFFFDVKADKEIKHYSPFGEKMLYEMQNYDDCELNTYTLQILLSDICTRRQGNVWDEYGKEIPLTDYSFAGGGIIHWNKGEKEFQLHEIKYKSEEFPIFKESVSKFVQGFLHRQIMESKTESQQIY